MKVEIDVPKDIKVANNIKIYRNSDQIISTLLTATPEQISVWIDNNVNDIADIKKVLKRLLILVIFLINRQE